MGIAKYKVVIAQSGKCDIKAVKTLDVFSGSHSSTGFEYRGYIIYLKFHNSCLLFYVVNEPKKTITVLRIMQDVMNWQFIIKRWQKEVGR